MYKQLDADRLFLAKVQDLITASKRTDAPRFTAFLDTHEAALAQQLLHRERETEGTLWGGFPEAERRILCVHPVACPPKETQFPLVCISITHRKADTLSHRDVLGALMALNIRRDAVGEMLFSPGMAQLFLGRTVAPLVLEELHKIGAVGVRLTEDVVSLPYQPTFQEISGTVASLRLDSIVSLAANISREKAAQMIHAQLVSVDGIPAQSVSAQLADSAVLSIRGHGKFRLDGIGTITKKGRLHITLQKYC